MRIGILGSGLMGGTLGTLFARAGHRVVFSYARSVEKLERLAREAGANATAGTPAEAVRDADAVLLAVHWLRIDDVLGQTGDLAGRIVVTCSLPMTADDSGLVIGHTTSGAETLAARIPRAKVVSAFGTLPSEVFNDVFEARGRPDRPHAVHCGDHADANAVAATLLSDVGFEPLDAGPLRLARYAEPFALLMGQLASEGDGGPEIAYRIRRYGA